VKLPGRVFLTFPNTDLSDFFTLGVLLGLLPTFPEQDLSFPQGCRSGWWLRLCIFYLG